MVITLREDGSEKIRKHCNARRQEDLAEHLGIGRAQIGRVLSGKHLPGNRFIAGVIDRCGLKFAFDHVFQIVEDA